MKIMIEYFHKDKKGELAVMNMEAYEQLCGKIELYSLLHEGLLASSRGEVLDFDTAIDSIRKECGL